MQGRVKHKLNLWDYIATAGIVVWLLIKYRFNFKKVEEVTVKKLREVEAEHSKQIEERVGKKVC